MVVDKEVERLSSGLVHKFNPAKILLFGSRALGAATEDSDIDICVVLDVHNSKDEIEDSIYSYIYDEEGLDFSCSVDVIVYTHLEWEESIKDSGTFASLILRKGLVIHG
ncbi:nucleotidyltransferase domain-containing protein [Candidatus Contubernalis alkaliaceticus]|uniref:nucleotidyltransferase domain-containing protein n=1 Tax=Candidatus Contubernalis alkaliaceticus TaxID=338645 RepID=UPI001F4BFCD6|nr:nucleotidyltransferase domain-containing protein [Candidatus Contubernalis alkalaceticus]UNC91388.1 nucleotidyltransferase domain-containing protein [Candidatus Contubernalis alkalaceticus]